MQLIDKHFSDKSEQCSTLLDLAIYLGAKVGGSISLIPSTLDLVVPSFFLYISTIQPHWRAVFTCSFLVIQSP